MKILGLGFETHDSGAALIEEYHRLSRIPSIVNTSFNMHEEAIVCTPEDGVKGFLAAELDYLAMGPFLVPNPEST